MRWLCAVAVLACGLAAQASELHLDGALVQGGLVHGQVVVGWGRPLDLQRIVLVDDEVRASPWEQELYRMAAPPGMTVAARSNMRAEAAVRSR